MEWFDDFEYKYLMFYDILLLDDDTLTPAQLNMGNGEWTEDTKKMLASRAQEKIQRRQQVTRQQHTQHASHETCHRLLTRICHIMSCCVNGMECDVM